MKDLVFRPAIKHFLVNIGIAKLYYSNFHWERISKTLTSTQLFAINFQSSRVPAVCVIGQQVSSVETSGNAAANRFLGTFRECHDGREREKREEKGKKRPEITRLSDARN
ncbi:hypothetical protein K0M31_003998, partial [Melipona bicolor]